MAAQTVWLQLQASIRVQLSEDQATHLNEAAGLVVLFLAAPADR